MLRRPLIHKHKKLARAALYLGAALLAGGLVWYRSSIPEVSFDDVQKWRQVDYEAHEPVRWLQEYLQIDTSFPDGDEIPGAEYLAGLLEAEGIAVEIERVGERNANLWAVIEGDNPRALVLHNHIDVEPILEPEAWKHPPFGGEIEVPWIFSRGAFDMKSVAIAQLAAMIDLQRRGVRPRRSLIFLATGDEETGSWLGSRRLIAQRPELVERFWAVLTEGGVVEAVDPEKVKYWGTEIQQKQIFFVVACHESRERLEALRDDVLEHAQRVPERHLVEPIGSFLAGYAPSRGLQLYQRLLTRPEELVELGNYSLLPPFVQALLVHEIGPYEVEESPEGGYRLQLVVHLLPGIEAEAGLAEVLPAWMTHGVTLGVEAPGEPVPASSPDHPAFRAVDGFLRRERPGLDHGPIVVPWSYTDARLFRAAGIPAYGFSPFVILSTDTLQMKGPNERMALPAFVDGVELYKRLVAELVS